MAHSLISTVVQKFNSILQDEVALLVGVTSEIEKLSGTFTSIQAVLEDAESRRVKDRAVKIWFEKVKDVAYDVDDILDEWTTEALRSQAPDEGDGSCFSFLVTCFLFPVTCFKDVLLRHKIGGRIKEARKRLAYIAEEISQLGLGVDCGERERVHSEVRWGEIRDRETSSLVDRPSIVGRENDKNEVLELLVRESSGEVNEVPIIVSIVGMGGLGKTTLAQLVYNDEKVKGHFDKRIWVCVSEDFDVKRITKSIIESATGIGCESLDLAALQDRLHGMLHKKRFLLVLDDVWSKDSEKWDKLRLPFQAGAPGSRIVVTTRIEDVAWMMGSTHMHKLAVLSDDECWLLFSHKALEHRSAEDRTVLEEIGRELVKKCGGVPLAAKTIGSAMCSRRTRRQWELVLRSEIWMSGDVLGVVLPALLLSYHDLPPALKQCFTYCSVFPKDWKIEKDVLVKLWVAQGFIRSDVSGDMEEIGGLYFDDLIRRSLLQDAELDGDKIKCKCKMHDLVHDLAQSIAGSDYSSLVEIGKQALSHLNNVRHSFLIVSNESDGDEAGDESDGDEAGDESDGAGDESDGDEAGDESDGAGDESHGDEARDESDGDEDDEVAYIWAPLYKAHKLRTLLHGWLTIPIKMVPNNVFHQLKCLRALDLSVTAIKELPQTVGQLIHLRYLDLSQTFIKELPEEVSNCINLQTLRLNRCEELSELPRGLRKMISLRHLEFEGADELKYLPHGIGRLTELRTLTKFIVGGDDQGRKCGELKHLNHLQGSLQIEDLGNVRSREEAREAQLYKKQYLHALIFKYSRHINDEPSSDDEVKRMEDVLEILQPHTNLKEFSLTGYEGSKLPKWIEDPVFSNLVQVKLSRCYKCKQLPGLGKLPSLKYLEIEGMEEVRKVGGEFSGDDNNDGSSGGGGVSFPKLQTLIFSNMTKWEEWELRGGDGEVMPSLLELQIKECLNLKALPSNLPVLLLQKLSISIGNDGLPSGGPLPVLPNLNELVICWSPELTSFPCGWLGQLKALQTLEIQNCRNLRSLPEELQHLTMLQHLEIYDCPLLKERFREGEDQYKISHIPNVSFRELPKADERGITFEVISLVHITHGFTVIRLI